MNSSPRIHFGDQVNRTVLSENQFRLSGLISKVRYDAQMPGKRFRVARLVLEQHENVG